MLNIPYLPKLIFLIAGLGMNVIATPLTSSISSNFNGTAIAAGDYIWFSSVVKVAGAPSTPFDVFVVNAGVTFSSGGTNYVVSLPDAVLHFDNNLSQATTSFNAVNDTWLTNTPTGLSGNYFLDAKGFQVPGGGLPGGISPVTMTADFTSSVIGLTLTWKWAAAVYTTFSSDLNALGVKASDAGSNATPFGNTDKAGTPENYINFVTGGARGGGGSNHVGGYSGTTSFTAPIETNATPEPGTMLLSIAGLISIAFFARKRGVKLGLSSGMSH